MRPSPLGVVPSQLVASMAAEEETMVAISAVVEAASMGTLVDPPPSATVKEERETGLPGSPPS